MRQWLQLTKTQAAGRAPDVLLGPWCIGAEVSGTPLLSVGAEPTDFVAAARAFPGVFMRVVEALTGIFNETFGISRSARYWALVTHPLLYHYLLSHLVKRSLVERALGGRTGEYEVHEAAPGPASSPLLYSDLRAAYEHDDLFNLELFSLVCRSLGVPGSSGRSRWRAPGGRAGVVRRLRRAALGAYVFSAATRRYRAHSRQRQLGEDAVVFKDIDPAFAHRLAERTHLRFVPIDEAVHLRPSLRSAPDEGLRTRVSWSHADPSIHSILQGLQYHLPVHQVETFPRLLEEARGQLSRHGGPGALLFGLLERPDYRVFAAEAMERGSRLVSIQHGGNYGESIAAVSTVIERYFSDRFVTFGWQEDPEKDVPAGGFRTFGLAPAPEPDSRPDGDVLLVAPLFQEYPHHLNWSPTTRHQERRILLEALPPAIRRRMIVRMRPGRSASARLEREWLAPFPELRIEEGREPIGTILGRSCLIVIGYVFSTTLLEAVKMDRPFLVFDQDFERFLTPVARPIYGELREAGLVRSDPAETAAAVEQILADVAGWWSAPRRRAAVTRYRERFVRDADLTSWSELMRELVGPGAAP